MATFFGEVTFTSTRAYDEEEDETSGETYEIEVSLNTEKKLNCTSLIVSFGFLANDFLEGCVHNVQCQSVGEIKIKIVAQLERTDTGDFHSRILKPSSLFLTSKGALLCQSSEDITSTLAGRITKSLLNLIDECCPVLVLSSHHASKLNSDTESGSGERCLTYSLLSQNFTSHVNSFPSLPQPSVLDSLPAAIMTECIIQDRPCVVYAAFTETSSPGDVDLVAQDFIRAISVPPFLNVIQYDKKYTSRMNRSEMLDRYM